MNRYVLAISGASGQPLGECALKLLLNQGNNVDLIISKGTYLVNKAEQQISIPVDPQKQREFWLERLGVTNGSLKCHKWDDLAASISSGSYKTKAMLIIPCSMGTVGRIASGISQDLISRCADVHLKEKRPLVIAPREMPWNIIHLENLTRLAKAGAQISPPIPSWYTNPTTLEQMTEFIIVRIFDSLGENLKEVPRWQ